MTTYQLYISIQEPIKKQIGKLGEFSFPKGQYVYTGSAKKNLESRIARHQSDDKKLRWHIDFLLSDPNVKIIDVKKTNRDECRWNKAINGKVIVKGFGASDCQSGCGSHLKYLGDRNG